MNIHSHSLRLRPIFCSLAIFVCCLSATAQPAFTVVPLGVRGGLDESNLSSYLVAAGGSKDYICLDAGTLYAGIRKAIDAGTFQGPVSKVLRSTIKAYFISHPHLDHVAGLIMNSPDDSVKDIYGLPFCLKVLQEKYFTWQSWANFGDEGEKPLLKKYHYVPMQPGVATAVENTLLTVTAFPLSHGAPYESTAFLVSSGASDLLYFGDTGADSLEHSGRMHKVWAAVGPLIKAGRLKAVFIEVSFPDEQPPASLFGHLTPALLQLELKDLAAMTGAAALKGLPIVITHCKPIGNNEEMIRKELLTYNPLQVKLIFPRQGIRLDF